MSNLLTDDEDLHIHIHGEKSVKIQFFDGDFEGSGFDEVENEARVKASTAWLTIGKLFFTQNLLTGGLLLKFLF